MYNSVGGINLMDQRNVKEIAICQAQVRALAEYGITLTQHPDLDFNNVWTTTRVSNVYQAVQIVDAYYQDSLIGFRDVFGGTSFTITSNRLTTGSCGIAPGTDNITLYSCGDDYDNPYRVNNLIHELGHILSNRAGSIPSGPNQGINMPRTWEILENDSGIASRFRSELLLGFGNENLRQNTLNISENRLGEEVADMFLYGVRGYPFTPFTNWPNEDGRAGLLRQSYVTGEPVDFPNDTAGPKDTIGLLSWSYLAAAKTASEDIQAYILARIAKEAYEKTLEFANKFNIFGYWSS